MNQKKIAEKEILENFKKVSKLTFSILEIQEAQKILPSYTGENPDFIINFDGQYIGIDLFMLCLNKSTAPINYGGKKYVNQMQKKKEHPDNFNSLEDLEENIKQRKEHPEYYPLIRQDDPSNILEERLLQKVRKIENYVTSKNWLLGVVDKFFNMGLVKNIYEDREVQFYKSLIKKIVGGIEKIDRVILFETGMESTDKFFEYKNV